MLAVVNSQAQTDDEVYYGQGDIRCGMINEKGKELLGFDYAALIPIDSTALIAQKADKWGIITPQGGEMLSFDHDDIADLGGGLLIVSKKGKYKILDFANKIFLVGEYDALSREPLSDDVIYALKGRKMGIINHQGHTILPQAYDSLRYLSPTLFIACKATKWGLVDRNDKPQGTFAYDEIEEFFNQSILMGRVRKGNKYGLINDKGKVVLQPIYQDVQQTTTADNFIVAQNGKCGVMDVRGKYVIRPVYEWLRAEPGNIYVAQKDGKVGLIDTKGKEIVPFLYQNIVKDGDLLIIQKDNYYGAMDMAGTEILPAQYINLSSYKNYIIGIEKSTFVSGLFDRKGEKLFPFVYNQVRPLSGSNDLFVVRDNGLYGVIGIAGKVVLPIKYTQISSLFGNHTDWFVVNKANDQGVVDAKDKIVVPIKYVSVAPYAQGVYLVQKFFPRK